MSDCTTCKHCIYSQYDGKYRVCTKYGYRHKVGSCGVARVKRCVADGGGWARKEEQEDG